MKLVTCQHSAATKLLLSAVVQEKTEMQFVDDNKAEYTDPEEIDCRRAIQQLKGMPDSSTIIVNIDRGGGELSSISLTLAFLETCLREAEAETPYFDEETPVVLQARVAFFSLVPTTIESLNYVACSRLWYRL